MTVPTQFVPRNYDVFAGLDVDKKSMAVIFTDHQQLMQSLRLPYSAEQLLRYVRKRFPEQRVAFVYEAGPTGFGLYDELVGAGHPKTGRGDADTGGNLIDTNVHGGTPENLWKIACWAAPMVSSR